MGIITSRKQSKYRIIAFPIFLQNWTWYATGTSAKKMAVQVPQILTPEQRNEVRTVINDLEKALELSEISEAKYRYIV